MDLKSFGLIVLTVVVTIHAACDSGWTQYSGKCIFFSHDHKWWNEAEAACEKMGAYLVTIDSEEKMNFLQEYLLVFQSFHYSHYWIGLKDAPIEGQWRWVETGSGLGAYNKWAEGQPDGSTAQNCVTTVIANGTAVYWADSRCEGHGHGGSNYICEKAAS